MDLTAHIQSKMLNIQSKMLTIQSKMLNIQSKMLNIQSKMLNIQSELLTIQSKLLNIQSKMLNIQTKMFSTMLKVLKFQNVRSTCTLHSTFWYSQWKGRCNLVDIMSEIWILELRYKNPKWNHHHPPHSLIFIIPISEKV